MNIRNYFWILFVFAISSCGGHATKSNDSIVYAESNDPELEQARQDAIASLDYFIESFNNHSNDKTFQFSLKIDFIDKEQHEHMWISLKSMDGEKFVGILDNEPQIVKNVKYGEQVYISKNQIEDWIIIDTKTDNWEGGYTVNVLQKRQQ